MVDESERQTATQVLADKSTGETIPLEEINALLVDESVQMAYRQRYPRDLHTRLLFSLTHEQLEEAEAREVWEATLRHRQKLNQQLGRDVGIAVAALDYLSNIRSVLDDPVLIEAERSQSISDVAMHDPLTELANRDVLQFALEKAFYQQRRTEEELCLLMLDIDDFKQVNDRHGHPRGDQVLRGVAAVIRRNVRNMDTAARYGGEEFVVLMPHTRQEAAMAVAERIRREIAQQSFADISVTVSVGFSSTRFAWEDPGALLQAADDALYDAKRLGKNRVICSAQCLQAKPG